MSQIPCRHCSQLFEWDDPERAPEGNCPSCGKEVAPDNASAAPPQPSISSPMPMEVGEERLNPLPKVREKKAIRKFSSSQKALAVVLPLLCLAVFGLILSHQKAKKHSLSAAPTNALQESVPASQPTVAPPSSTDETSGSALTPKEEVKIMANLGGLGDDLNDADQDWVAKSDYDSVGIRKAAEDGNVHAQKYMAFSLRGSNDKDSLSWRLKAANNGDVGSQYQLARQFGAGDKVERDTVASIKWLTMAAENGHAEAQLVLGACLSVGKDVRKNDEEAAKWYRKSAEQGNVSAAKQIANDYARGKGVTEDQKEATRWYRIAAEKGDADAQITLSVRYSHGSGVEKDRAASIKWLTKAAESGHAEAQFFLGFQLSLGELVRKDDEEAAKWFRKSAEQGDVSAISSIASAYDQGKGVPKDQKEASRWYRIAAEKGDTSSQIKLSLIYQLGEGVPKDSVFAYMWMNIAAASDQSKELQEIAVESRNGFERMMTREQIAEGQRLSREWQQKSDAGSHKEN